MPITRTISSYIASSSTRSVVNILSLLLIAFGFIDTVFSRSYRKPKALCDIN